MGQGLDVTNLNMTALPGFSYLVKVHARCLCRATSRVRSFDGLRLLVRLGTLLLALKERFDGTIHYFALDVGGSA